MSRALAAGVARFLPNPEEFWGPKPRAGRHLSSKHIASHGAAFVNGTLRAEGKPPIESAGAGPEEEGSDAKRQKTEQWSINFLMVKNNSMQMVVGGIAEAVAFYRGIITTPI